MSFINKNVNIILLFLIAGLIAALAGMTAYYQSTYFDLSSEYKEKLGEVNSLLENLEASKAQLNETLEQIGVKEEREKDLSSKYSELKTENTYLSETLNETNLSLVQTQDELSSTLLDLSDARMTVLELNNTVINMTYNEAYIKSQSKEAYDEIGEASDLIQEYTDPNSTRYVSDVCDEAFGRVLARVSGASIAVRGIRLRLGEIP